MVVEATAVMVVAVVVVVVVVAAAAVVTVVVVVSDQLRRPRSLSREYVAKLRLSKDCGSSRSQCSSEISGSDRVPSFFSSLFLFLFLSLSLSPPLLSLSLSLYLFFHFFLPSSLSVFLSSSYLHSFFPPYRFHPSRLLLRPSFRVSRGILAGSRRILSTPPSAERSLVSAHSARDRHARRQRSSLATVVELGARSSDDHPTD